ncbi:BCL-6 corepressor [Gossypium arboreum]|uniref:BCL-6 corepressor n=1 Tax=Gossypium arboreum TaxID=29729 RepID=A0A0B0N0E1_GOSAR|nr:BCL-6 corepressor [Gossypium arboreum]
MPCGFNIFQCNFKDMRFVAFDLLQKDKIYNFNLLFYCFSEIRFVAFSSATLEMQDLISSIGSTATLRRQTLVSSISSNLYSLLGM